MTGASVGFMISERVGGFGGGDDGSLRGVHDFRKGRRLLRLVSWLLVLAGYKHILLADAGSQPNRRHVLRLCLDNRFVLLFGGLVEARMGVKQRSHDRLLTYITLHRSNLLRQPTLPERQPAGPISHRAT